MTENNLILLYKNQQFSTLADAVDCEYTGCSAPTGKLFVISEDVWQFCHKHASLVLNAFCKVNTDEKK